MLTIRAETCEDFQSIRDINIRAFGRTKEADLVDKLRDHSVLPVSLVAFINGAPVGHVAFSPAWIKNESASFAIVTLAPLAVVPSFQKQGIGSELMRAGLDCCRDQGHAIVVLVGHPGYYPRFGFVQAKQHGLDCEFEVPDDAWMVCELVPGALGGKKGKVYFQPQFRECV